MSVEQSGICPTAKDANIGISLRPATHADILTIRTIASAAWPVAFGHLVSEEFLRHELNREYSDEALIIQMEEQGHRFILAEQAGSSSAIGFVSYAIQEGANDAGARVATVHKLYLLPNLKGKGYGATLLNAAIVAAADAGSLRIELSVNRQNPAVKFYEKLGFSIVCESDIEVGPGFVRNDYLMAKPLT